MGEQLVATVIVGVMIGLSSVVERAEGEDGKLVFFK